MSTCARQILIAVTLSCCVATWGMAIEPFDGRTQTWSGLFFTTKIDKLSTEPLVGTNVGVREVAGLAFFDNGDVATVNAWLSFFSDERLAHYKGYALFRFDDGSTQTASLVGCRSATGAETGEFSFVCGSGRYAGIVGDGSFASTGFLMVGDPIVCAQSTYRLLTDREE